MVVRRVRYWLVLVCFVAASFIGCGKSQKPTENPFTYSYKVDVASVEQVRNGDSIQSMVASTPFYPGAGPMPGMNTAEFDQARQAKVEEIIADAASVVEAAERLEPGVEQLRLAYVGALESAVNEEKKISGFVNATMKELVKLKSEQAVALAVYHSLDTTSPDKLVSTFMEYTRVVKAVQLGGLYLQDVNNLVGWSATGIKVLGESKNAKVKAAAATLDKKMEAYDKLRDDLKAVAEGLARVEGGLKQLETADYHMAQSAVAFLEAEIPAAREKLKEATPRNGMTADDIAFLEAYLAEFEDTAGLMRAQLDEVDESKLLEVKLPEEMPDYPIAVAWADGASKKSSGTSQTLKHFALSTQSLKDAGSVIPGTDQGTRSFSEAVKHGWKSLKSAVQGTQAAIGAGIDTLNAGTRSIMNVPVGLYYGNSVADMCDNMKQNFREIETNFKNQTSGSSTLRTAKEYFENVEKGAQDLTEGGTEYITGEGYTSWIMGHIAKATASIFTGLGKGIVALADQTSSTGEMVEGALDVGFAITGGSKVILKGTQVPALAKGLGEGGEIVGKKGFNYLTKVAVEDGNKALQKALLKPITGQEAVILGSTQKAILTALQKTNEQLTKRLADLMKKGAQAWGEGARETLESSLNDYVRKQFQGNIKGFVDAVRTALGESAGAYVNNVVGEMADDYLKEMVREALDGEPVFDGTYAGNATAPGVPGRLQLVITGPVVKGTVTGTYTGSTKSEIIKIEAVPFRANVSGNLARQPDRTARINCQISGHLTGSDGDTYGFSGSLNGRVVEGKASGSWSAGNEWGSPQGSWSATLQ